MRIGVVDNAFVLPADVTAILIDFLYELEQIIRFK